MADEQPIDLKALLRRIEVLERKVGIFSGCTYIEDQDFEEFIENIEDHSFFPFFPDVILHVKKRVLAGSILGLKPENLLKIKRLVSKKTWKDISEEMVSYVEGGVDNTAFRKSFFEELNQMISHGLIYVSKADLKSKEEWAKEYAEREKRAKAEELARQNRVKSLTAWKREVFDQLEKS